MSEVTSVNGKTGVVVLTPADVEAVPTAIEGQPNGVATLDSSGVLHGAQLPSAVANSSSATISPLTHGAKWDGVTDDSAAMQASINEAVERGGVPIMMPSGVGVINSEPEIPKNLAFRVTIRGVDRDGTTVKLTSAMRFLTYAATEPGDTLGNVNLSDFTVDGNNQLTVVAHGSSVIIGQKFTSVAQVNVKNVDIHRIRTKNVPALAKKEGGRRNLEIYSYHSEPGLPLNVIENIKIGQLILEQGQSGVTVLAQGPSTPLPLNVRFRNVLIEDITHTIVAAPSETGYSSHVQIGQNGWTDRPETIVIQRIWGKNSADVGVEADLACVLRDIETTDANNCGILLNTFNPSVSEPIVAKITELAVVGSTIVAVSSSTAFKVGHQIAFYGTGVATSEVRTVKGKPDGTHIELSEATGIEWTAGTFISQVDNQEGARWTCRKIRSTRTVTLAGLGRGFVIQNSENVLPCPDVDIDGAIYHCTASDVGSGGEALQVQTGTANSPTGSPALIKIRGLKLDRENLENSTSGTKNFNPFNFIMRGPGARVDLVGEAIVVGAGNTGTGKLPGQILRFVRSVVDMDIELTTKWTLGSTGGERWCGVSLSEGEAADIGGRLRHIARTSKIESGGGAQKKR